jgi:ABC-2 type transport system ATP-binding protein
MSSILAFDGVVREYVRGVPVLNGVTFSLGEGEIVGLLGRNGSGKTTLLHIAIGVLFPQAGSVSVFGMCPRKDALAVKKRVGYVAEDQALPPSSSIAELIAFHKYLFPKWDDELEQQILRRFSLAKNNRIALLSKGQARAVALLLAICHRPELLLLDEPAAGLDPAARREFLEVAIQFLNRAGATILYSSHYMNDIERIGSRVLMLDEGKIRIDTSVDELREDYSLALVSENSVPDVEILREIPGCVGTRLDRGDWHAVFRGVPEDVKSRIEHSLGSNGILCDRMTLEDLFVELMGEKRGTRAS